MDKFLIYQSVVSHIGFAPCLHVITEQLMCTSNVYTLQPLLGSRKQTTLTAISQSIDASEIFTDQKATTCFVGYYSIRGTQGFGSSSEVARRLLREA